MELKPQRLPTSQKPLERVTLVRNGPCGGASAPTKRSNDGLGNIRGDQRKVMQVALSPPVERP